jgi:anti-sigma regulatory factor (Ser/Thr protein kinase)
MKELGDEQHYVLSPTAAGLARRRLDIFIDAIESSLLDDLRIITTELVANAVLHSGRAPGAPITVKNQLIDDILRVDVIDYGHRVVILTASDDATTGLGLVAAISDRWAGAGVTPFFVWAELDVRTNGLVRRRT